MRVLLERYFCQNNSASLLYVSVSPRRSRFLCTLISYVLGCRNPTTWVLARGNRGPPLIAHAQVVTCLLLCGCVCGCRKSALSVSPFFLCTYNSERDAADFILVACYSQIPLSDVNNLAHECMNSSYALSFDVTDSVLSSMTRKRPNRFPIPTTHTARAPCVGQNGSPGEHK